MNERQKFYNEVFLALEKALESEGATLSQVEVQKNNTTLQAISVRFEGSNMAPTIYPEGLFEDFQNGHSIEEIVSGIKAVIADEAEHIINFDTNKLNKAEAPNFLRLSVVNYESNKEWLAEVPHERMADLAVFGKWDFGQGHTTKVTGQFLAMLQMTKEEMLQVAKSNTAKSMKLGSMKDEFIRIMVKDGMDQEMAAMMAEPMGEAPFKILSNESGVDGAAVIADPSVLRQVQEQVGADFYILPSSIHEVLIVAKSTMDDPAELSEMVGSINENEVPVEDRLSDHVYEFDGHGIKLAGATEGIQKEHGIAESFSHHRSR